MFLFRPLSFVMHQPSRWLCRIVLTTALCLPCLLLISCSDLTLGGNPAKPTAPVTPSQGQQGQQVPLANLHWCGKPLMIFRDEGAPTTTATVTATGTPSGTTPKTLTDWPEVEANLGFSVYLPPSLPQGSCLVSASGTVHDPILGGSFIISYLLPDHSPLSLSEAPLRSQNTQFQCNPSSSAASVVSQTGTAEPSPTGTQLPGQLCTGVRGTTNIVFSARGSTASLQQLFNGFQPQVHWIPAS